MHATQSLRSQLWQAYRSSKLAVWALAFIGGLVLLAVLAPLLATHLPLYCRYNGAIHFPAFSPTQMDTLMDIRKNQPVFLQYQQVPDWRDIELESVIWAPVPYSPQTKDRTAGRFLSPFEAQYYQDIQEKRVSLPLRFRHWLGTMPGGKDVLSHLIHGTRVSLLVGLIAVGLATLIGVILGALAGFFGNHGLRLRRGIAIALLLSLLPAWFYGGYIRRFVLADAAQAGLGPLAGHLLISIFIAAGILALGYGLGKVMSKTGTLTHRVSVPLDSLISRLIEVLNSLPVLLLLISVSYLFEKRSLVLVMVIIGLTGWTGIARLVRAEMMRITQLEYLEAARALGLSKSRIIWRHALPNGIAPVLVVVAFGMGSAIIAEAALSFLNIGVPNDVPTWGRILSLIRANFTQAWWLAVSPSLAIFLTVLSFNLIGERLRDVLDPKTSATGDQ